MNSTIINIIKNKHSSIEAKERALLELEKDIDVAKKYYQENINIVNYVMIIIYQNLL